MPLQLISDSDFTSDLVDKVNTALSFLNVQASFFRSPVLNLTETGQAALLVPAQSGAQFALTGPVLAAVLSRSTGTLGTAPVLQFGTETDPDCYGTLSLGSPSDRKIITGTPAPLTFLTEGEIWVSVKTAATGLSNLNAQVLMPGLYTDVISDPFGGNPEHQEQ